MVGKYQLSSIEKNYGIKNTTVESLASSVTVLTRLTEQPYRELEALIRKNPEEMEDAAQLESLNGELQDKKSYLLVRKNDTIAYIGTEASKAEKVISSSRSMERRDDIRKWHVSWRKSTSPSKTD